MTPSRKLVRLVELQSEIRLTKQASSQIDQTIAELFGYDTSNGQWKRTEYSSWQDIPNFSESFDQTIALINNELNPINIVINISGQPRASIVMAKCITQCFSVYEEMSASLALCSAFLSVMITRTEETING